MRSAFVAGPRIPSYLTLTVLIAAGVARGVPGASRDQTAGRFDEGVASKQQCINPKVASCPTEQNTKPLTKNARTVTARPSFAGKAVQQPPVANRKSDEPIVGTLTEPRNPADAVAQAPAQMPMAGPIVQLRPPNNSQSLKAAIELPPRLASALSGVPILRGAPRAPVRNVPQLPRADYSVHGGALYGSRYGGIISQIPNPHPFTLTPRIPFLEGQGYLAASDVDPEADVIDFRGGPPDPGTSLGVDLVIFAQAGQIYLIDETLEPYRLPFQQNPPGCQITVDSGVGQRTTSECLVSNVVQHVVFAYTAALSGENWIHTAIDAAHTCFFRAATVTPIQ